MWLLAALFQRGAVGCICGFKSRTRTHIITNGYVNAEEAHKGIFLRRPPACTFILWLYALYGALLSQRARVPHRKEMKMRAPLKFMQRWHTNTSDCENCAAAEGKRCCWRDSLDFVYSWLCSITAFVARRLKDTRLPDLHVQLLS
jgi:hypothetical protein